MDKEKYIIGSWKMFGSLEQLEAFTRGFARKEKAAYVVGIAPEFPFLSLLKEKIPAYFTLVAQNVASNEGGAYTGEVSATSLYEVGVRWVILGHSERRSLFAETDAIIQAKLSCAIKAGLKPIICVDDQFTSQLQTSLPDGLRSKDYFIAYEPLGSIGTGKIPSLEEITLKLIAIKGILEKRYGSSCPVFYGGSVTPENSASILALKPCDGVLVGGASLDAESFYSIVSGT